MEIIFSSEIAILGNLKKERMKEIKIMHSKKVEKDAIILFVTFRLRN